MDSADLAALPDFRTALSGYSAIVIASDHGGMLGEAELTFLNGQAVAIVDYLNAGGGLYAESESNATGQIGATPRFAFLPFLASSTDFNADEVSNTVTVFGSSLGLVDADVNGNFSHNYFAPTAGMSSVDLYNGSASRPLTLAYRGLVDIQGPIPEPQTYALMVLGLLAVGMAHRRRTPAG